MGIKHHVFTFIIIPIVVVIVINWEKKAIMNMILQTKEVIGSNLCTKIKEAFI